MKERVSIILGKKNVMLVAPHGADDTNTDIIAEQAAKELNCYAVINRGFERSELVDVNNDKANCNRIDHCKQDVVYEEFLKPIIKLKNKIVHKWHKISELNIFYIHGCGDIVHKRAGEEVAMVVGYGLGIKKDSLTCQLWRKNLFCDCFENVVKKSVFEGKGGGKYAGRDTNNLNQYFRKHSNDAMVQSMQLEIPYKFRKNKEEASNMGTVLAFVISNYLKYNHYDDQKSRFKFL